MTSIRLIDLVQKLGAELYGNGDIIITSISSIKSAKANHITFISNSKYRKQLIQCQASAIILTKNDLPFIKKNISAIIVNNPYLAYAHIAKIFDDKPKFSPKIAANAVISSSAQLGKNISVGNNTVIESNAICGDNVIIGSGCYIGENSRIGSNSILLSNVTVYHAIEIGENCILQSGSVIGSDGFGYANDCGNWVKIPQLGGVIIGNHVEIGACTTIDRGSLDNTCIGNGVIIDNQCQIAHNVIVGENTAIASGVIMAGSLKIGRRCMIGGATVINGHIEICDDVTITGMGMVTRAITKPGIYSSGIPLQPNNIWRKTAVLVMNISDMNKRLRAIEQKIHRQNQN